MWWKSTPNHIIDIKYHSCSSADIQSIFKMPDNYRFIYLQINFRNNCNLRQPPCSMFIVWTSYTLLMRVSRYWKCQTLWQRVNSSQFSFLIYFKNQPIFIKVTKLLCMMFMNNVHKINSFSPISWLNYLPMVLYWSITQENYFQLFYTNTLFYLINTV